MEKLELQNGHSLKHKGSILLTAILLTGLMSILSLLLLSNYRVVAEFSFRTRQYYEMRIMISLFLADYPNLPPEQQQNGEVYYNKGKVSYRLEKTQLVVTAHVGKYQTVYYEPLMKETEETISSTEMEKEIEEKSENSNSS